MSNAQRIKALVQELERLQAEKFFGDVTLKLKAGELVPHFEVRKVADLDHPTSR